MCRPIPIMRSSGTIISPPPPPPPPPRCPKLLRCSIDPCEWSELFLFYFFLSFFIIGRSPLWSIHEQVRTLRTFLFFIPPLSPSRLGLQVLTANAQWWILNRRVRAGRSHLKTRPWRGEESPCHRLQAAKSGCMQGKKKKIMQELLMSQIRDQKQKISQLQWEEVPENDRMCLF